MTLSANNSSGQSKSGQSKSGQSKSVGQRIRLPRPDLRNITVLTNKLPNAPILPWNHYDLPEDLPELDAADSSVEDTP